MRLLIAFLILLTRSSAFCASDETAEVNLNILKPGQLMRVLTDGQPIWVLYRSVSGLKNIENMSIAYDAKNDAKGVQNPYRSIKPEYFVVYGGCPDSSELPAYDETTGFTCLNSCKKFDLAGRPLNACAGKQPMRIPEHHYKNANTIVVRVKGKNGI